MNHSKIEIEMIETKLNYSHLVKTKFSLNYFWITIWIVWTITNGHKIMKLK